MKRMIAIAGLCLAPLAVQAAMTDEQAVEAVETALSSGQSADAIIETLIADGRTLQDATLVAAGASSGVTQLQIARAGICASADVLESQQIGQALVEMVGEGQAAADINGLVAMYAATQCTTPIENLRVEQSPGGGTAVLDPPVVSPAS